MNYLTHAHHFVAGLQLAVGISTQCSGVISLRSQARGIFTTTAFMNIVGIAFLTEDNGKIYGHVRN